MEWLRVVNVLMGFGALVLLLIAFFRQWSGWSRKTREHWWALSAWVALSVYGAVENLVQGNPGGGRVFLQFLAVLVTFKALLTKGELRADPVIGGKHDRTTS